jgi:hypothetical protein
LLDSVVGEDECGEFVEEREIVEFSDLIIAEVNAFEEIESGTHVLDLGQFVPSEIELSLIEGISELMGMLDKLCRDFHCLL